MNQGLIQSLSSMTYGIYILTTTGSDRQMNGMVASWVSQVSCRPPMIMVAVRKNRYTHRLILHSRTFALNVVKKDSRVELSPFKGGSLPDKFSGLCVDRKRTGCPILRDALAYMDCKLRATLGAGDHTLFIGEVLDAERLHDGDPLTSRDCSGVYLGAA